MVDTHQDPKTEYIFIVGSFRSGTTLLYNILNAAEGISICWETHFFGHFLSSGYLEEIKKAGDLHIDTNVHKAVDAMYRFKKGYWTWFRENVEREQFTQSVLNSPRDYRSIFQLLMEVYAGDQPVKGEKTPSHLYYVPILLEWFPDSKIVHTFRDPRAIFASELRKKRQPRFASPRHMRLQKFGLLIPYILLQVTLTWLRAAYLHSKYKKTYPDRYTLVKFEDFLQDPETQIERLSDFLNIPLSTELTQDVPSNSSYLKQREKTGLDPQAANRWQGELSRWIIFWFSAFCRKRLKEFEYI